MARPRKTQNDKLPMNLYPSGAKAWRYRHPITGAFHGLGTNKAKAIKNAKILNTKLMPDDDLVVKIMSRDCTVSEYADRWINEIVPKRNLALTSVKKYRTCVKVIKETWGGYELSALSTYVIAQALEKMTPRTANMVRGRLVDMLREAKADGHVQTNEAEDSRIAVVSDKARERMSYEQFVAIRACGSPWLRNAMDLALITLQRAGDIVMMTFDQVDGDHLYVVQGKTKKYDTGYLRIAITPQLRDVIDRCRDDVVSPYIVHYRPSRILKSNKLTHWTQVPYSKLALEFTAARDKSHLFDGWKKGTAPTFHEIRALGIKLYKDQGVNPQQLAGHASEKMTKNYDSGHDEIRWVEAVANLEMKHV